MPKLKDNTITAPKSENENNIQDFQRTDISDEQILQEAVDEAVVDQTNQINQETGQNLSPQENIDRMKRDIQQGQAQVMAAPGAQARALSQLQDLVSLIVVTYQEKTILYSQIGFLINSVSKYDLEQGNGIRFIKHVPVAGKDFEPNKFIPDQLDPDKFRTYRIEFYDSQTGALKPNSSKRKWEITYRQADLIQYFIDGQLSTFINEQILGKIKQSMKIWMYDLIMKNLVKTAGKGKHLAASVNATNLFDALTMDLLPEIRRMHLNSAEYNYDQAEQNIFDASHKNDLVMLVHPDVKVKLDTNIKTQLFNAAKLDLYDFVGQIHEVNFKFNLVDGQPVTMATDTYIDPNTIIVFDKRNYFKFIKMLEVSGRQDFPYNMTTLEILHYWSTFDFLPWGKVLTYTNPNLNTQP